MKWIAEELAEKKLCPFQAFYPGHHCITCGCLAWEYFDETETEQLVKMFPQLVEAAAGRCRRLI